MSTYIVFIRDKMKDLEEFGVYSKKAAAAGAGHPLSALAFYGDVETLEGETADGVVIVKFPTMEDARTWYHSPAYQEAKEHRVKASDYRVVMVEGLS